MTAQVQFFCSAAEEFAILERITVGLPDVVIYEMDGQRMKETNRTTPFECLPRWPRFACLYFWAKRFGPLQWHDKRPKVEGANHRSLVARLFARQDWDEKKLAEGERLLDQELSPGICYKRPEQFEGRFGPCTLIAPPSNLQRISSAYAKWVNRVFSWIRGRGTIVHDWRTPSLNIPNPHSFLNTVYAFPEPLKEIQSGVHSYSIL